MQWIIVSTLKSEILNGGWRTMDDNRVWNVVTLMNISSGELNECVSILCRYIQSTQQKIVFILQSDILLLNVAASDRDLIKYFWPMNLFINKHILFAYLKETLIFHNMLLSLPFGHWLWLWGIIYQYIFSISLYIQRQFLTIFSLIDIFQYENKLQSSFSDSESV